MRKFIEKLKKRKKSKKEMVLLENSVGADIVVEILYSNNKNTTFERGILGEIIPYDRIELLVPLDDPIDVCFIGFTQGIVKVTDKATGELLYENTDLNYSNENTSPIEVNMLREEKYGTSKFNVGTQ